MPAPAPSRPFPSFWTLHLAGWAAIGLSMWIGVLAHVDDPGRAFVGKMVFAITGGTLTLGLRPLYRRLHERGVSIPKLIITSAVCSYALTVVWSILHKGSVNLLWQWVDGEALTIPPFSWLISGTLFYTFIPMAWSVLYFGVKYYQDVQAERERALAAEGLAWANSCVSAWSTMGRGLRMQTKPARAWASSTRGPASMPSTATTCGCTPTNGHIFSERR